MVKIEIALFPRRRSIIWKQRLLPRIETKGKLCYKYFDSPKMLFLRKGITIKKRQQKSGHDKKQENQEPRAIK